MTEFLTPEKLPSTPKAHMCWTVLMVYTTNFLFSNYMHGHLTYHITWNWILSVRRTLVYNNNNNLVWDDRTVLYSINDNIENFKWEILLKTKQIFGENAGV